MKHPFKVGMTADRVVAIAKQRKIFRVAKNEIIGLESTRYVVKWHFFCCSLIIKFDFQNPPYRVFKILKPLDTGKTIDAKTSNAKTRRSEAHR